MQTIRYLVVLTMACAAAGCAGGALEYADAPPSDTVSTLQAPGQDTAVVAAPPPAAGPVGAAPANDAGVPVPPLAGPLASAVPQAKSIFAYLPGDADTIGFANVPAVTTGLDELAIDLGALQDILNQVPSGTGELAVALRLTRTPPPTADREAATRADAEATTEDDDSPTPEYTAFVLRRTDEGYREEEIDALLKRLTRSGADASATRSPFKKITVENMTAYDFLQDHEFARLFHPEPGVLILVRSDAQAEVENYHRRPTLAATSPLVQHTPQLSKELFVVAHVSTDVLRGKGIAEFVRTLVAKAPIVATYMREGVTVAVGAQLTTVKGIAAHLWHGDKVGLTLEAAIDADLLRAIPAFFAESGSATDAVDAVPEQEILNLTR